MKALLLTGLFLSAFSILLAEEKTFFEDADIKAGKKIYNQTCFVCHGTDGKGALPGMPNFTKSDGPLSKQNEILIENMLKGFQSKGSAMAMPPKGGNPKLTKEDLIDCLLYMRKTFREDIDK